MPSLSRVRVESSTNPQRVLSIGVAVGIVGLLASLLFGWWAIQLIRRREVLAIDWGEFSEDRELELEDYDEGEEDRWFESEERTLRSSGSSWRRGMRREVVSPKLCEVELVSSLQEEKSTTRRPGGSKTRSRSGSRGVKDARLNDSLSALQPLTLDFLPPKETSTIDIPHPFSFSPIPFRLPSHHHPQPKAGVLRASFIIFLPRPPSPATPTPTRSTNPLYPLAYPESIRDVPEMEIGSIRLESEGRRRGRGNSDVRPFGDTRPS